MEGIIQDLFSRDITFQRPTYSTYALGNLVRRKRETLGYSISDLAKHWDVPEEMVEAIEDGRRSLNYRFFMLISQFIDISYDALTQVYTDDNNIYFRTSEDENSEKAKATIRMANYLFHEILAQRSLVGEI